MIVLSEHGRARRALTEPNGPYLYIDPNSADKVSRGRTCVHSNSSSRLDMSGCMFLDLLHGLTYVVFQWYVTYSSVARHL